jgi:uncharacterized membrane protein YjfL (UPF0719 family)
MSPFMLTFWVNIMQTIYYSLNIPFRQFYPRFLDTFCDVTRTFTLWMTIIFWRIYYTEPELIHSASMNVSAELNFLQHGMPFIMIFAIRRRPQNIDRSYPWSTMAIAAYLSMLLAFKQATGTWPYAILNGYSTVSFLMMSAPIVIADLIITIRRGEPTPAVQ